MRMVVWVTVLAGVCSLIGCGGGGDELPDDLPPKDSRPPACIANPKACI